ncbi:FAD/NAD(P)-binding protein [Dactylosporangium sp. CA-092794]|uniref:FAD/NAD(P)-binding protein n=1 Tax=Dactylosporangium sp. CA-092794 TaxID=3239929 RepID=UPI003D93C1B9
MPVSPAVVAIVGGGPRGVIVLGRLLARLTAGGAGESPRRPVRIHLIDPFDNGRVWPADLPEYLLMNSRTRDVTLFSDAAMPDLPAVAGGMDFLTWLAGRAGEDPPGPAGFATRAAFGRHLAWARTHLAALPAPGVEVVSHRARVVDLVDAPHGTKRRLSLVTAAGATDALDADAVVLATGHHEAATTHRRAGPTGAFFAPPHMIGELDLDPLGPGRRVAVLGAGLNCFDLVAALTEGRGGRFEADAAGTLHYRPGGAEPLLFVGSRRGVPHLSRAREPLPARPRHCTEDALRNLLARSRPLDFRAEVWPLIERDLVAAHADAGGGPLDIDRVLHPLAPGAAPAEFGSADALTAWMADFLAADAAESVARPRGPMRAVGEMLSALAPAVRTLVAAGRIDGRSYVRDVEGWFNGIVAHLSSGPPVVRFEQLGALVRAGLVRFVGGRVRLFDDGPGFGVECPNLGTTLHFDAVVEARLFAPDARRPGDPLTAALVRAGRARPLRLPAAHGPAVPTAALDVTRDDLCLLGAGGAADERVFALGVPLEGVHWLTAALPVAHREDPSLRGADRVAVAVLRRLGLAP